MPRQRQGVYPPRHDTNSNAAIEIILHKSGCTRRALGRTNMRQLLFVAVVALVTSCNRAGVASARRAQSISDKVNWKRMEEWAGGVWRQAPTQGASIIVLRYVWNTPQGSGFAHVGWRVDQTGTNLIPGDIMIPITAGLDAEYIVLLHGDRPMPSHTNLIKINDWSYYTTSHL